MEYDYFSDGFGLVYNWINRSLWSDKEFVLNILELDSSTVIHVPDQLAADEEFRAYIEETVDLEWETKGVPQEKIPQWIQNWLK